MVTQPFHHSTLEVARLRRRMTVSELSTLSGLSTWKLRKMGEREQPSSEDVQAVARALNYPCEFFYAGELEMPTDATFRARASMTRREEGAGLASAALSERLSTWLENRFEVPDSSVPNLGDMAPSLAAETLRELWGLGERPIGNLIRLLEAKGVRVFCLAEQTLRLDAFATWMDARPLVFLNGFNSGERSRFDAAHELGHLCLHREGQQGKDVESEANEFAAAFLMPFHDVIACRVFPSMHNLIHVKARWGVAVSALARRYKEMALITEERARGLYIEMARKGFLKSEPQPIQGEKSTLWAQVLQALWRERKTIEDLATWVSLPVDEVVSLVFATHSQQKTAPSPGAKPPLCLVN